jgi:hypothetical protein
METFLATVAASVALAVLGFPFWVAMQRPSYFSNVYLGYSIVLNAAFLMTMAYVIGYDAGAQAQRTIAEEHVASQGMDALVPYLQADHFGGYGYLVWPLPVLYLVIIQVCGRLLRPEETPTPGE